ncbi:hypothetical protein [Sphingomonas colocasiae]|uniref:DUF1849 family protein n=1 Tax=Sphingomonas colocasiae TaxID=1848973 RepID=A0ABS7PR94_9SPHN|nr:hypothetical protein [Sphingomonas colocasiae]MBY8823857.1 hypothetical protein [Sphingomonas colocasiae]
MPTYKFAVATAVLAFGLLAQQPALAKRKPLKEARYAKCIEVKGFGALDDAIKSNTVGCARSEEAEGDAGPFVQYKSWFETKRLKAKPNERLTILVLALEYSRTATSIGDVEVTSNLSAGSERFTKANLIIGGALVEREVYLQKGSGRECGSVPNPVISNYTCTYTEYVAMDFPQEEINAFIAQAARNPLGFFDIKLTSERGSEKIVQIPLTELRLLIEAEEKAAATLPVVGLANSKKIEKSSIAVAEAAGSPGGETSARDRAKNSENLPK